MGVTETVLGCVSRASPSPFCTHGPGSPVPWGQASLQDGETPCPQESRGGSRVLLGKPDLRDSCAFRHWSL